MTNLYTTVYIVILKHERSIIVEILVQRMPNESVIQRSKHPVNSVKPSSNFERKELCKIPKMRWNTKTLMKRLDFRPAGFGIVKGLYLSRKRMDRDSVLHLDRVGISFCLTSIVWPTEIKELIQRKLSY